MKRALRLAAGAALTAAGPVSARPSESVSFPSVPSNGVLGSAANQIRTHVFSGGFALARIDLSGTLTAVHPSTWRTDSRVQITAPSGQSIVFQPFASGGTYSSLPFAGTVLLAPGSDPIGEWSFRFFEVVDDGGVAAVDALCTLNVTLTDVPPSPPLAAALGTMTPAGAVVTAIPFPPHSVRWYQFQLSEPIAAPLNSYLDFDTDGTSLIPSAGTGLAPNDTELGLYDATGALIASDDDSGDGATSQLTFGVGTRAAIGNGQPYNGRHGSLQPGTYYVAVGQHNLEFGPVLWAVTPGGGIAGTIQLNVRTNAGDACAPDCNMSGTLTIADLGCFQSRFVAGDPYADCNASGSLTIADFGCFQTRFVTGCP